MALAIQHTHGMHAVQLVAAAAAFRQTEQWQPIHIRPVGVMSGFEKEREREREREVGASKVFRRGGLGSFGDGEKEQTTTGRNA